MGITPLDIASTLTTIGFFCLPLPLVWHMHRNRGIHKIWSLVNWYALFIWLLLLLGAALVTWGAHLLDSLPETPQFLVTVTLYLAAIFAVYPIMAILFIDLVYLLVFVITKRPPLHKANPFKLWFGNTAR